MLGPPIEDLEATCTTTTPETSRLIALPAEILKRILQHAIKDSILELRKVQKYGNESAIRIIDYPTREAINVDGPMPLTVSSPLRVKKKLNREVVNLLNLPDTIFCPNREMITLMDEMDKVHNGQMRRPRNGLGKARRPHAQITKTKCRCGDDCGEDDRENDGPDDWVDVEDDDEWVDGYNAWRRFSGADRKLSVHSECLSSQSLSRSGTVERQIQLGRSIEADITRHRAC